MAACLTLAPWVVRNEMAFHRFVPTTTQSGFSLISVFNDKSRGADGDYRLVGPADVGVPPPRAGRTNEAEYGQLLVRTARRYAQAHPSYVVKVGVLNTLRTLELWKGASTGFVSFGANGLPASWVWKLLVPASFALYLLAILGVMRMLRDPSISSPPPFFYVLPVALLITSAFAAGALRYRLPFDPLLLAFAGLAVSWPAARRPTSA